MKIVAIIQARMGSQRLPGKSMMQIAGKPLLWYVLERTKKAKLLDSIILATSTNSENDPLCRLAEELNVDVFRGSENDVLSRYVEAGKSAGADIIVRICADNPLVDPGEIDRIVRFHISRGTDYSFNHIPANDNNYPDGFGAEVVNAQLLYSVSELALEPEEREHVTLHIIRNPDKYSISTFDAPYEILGPDIKLDIDTADDFMQMKGLIESLPDERKPFWSASDIIHRYRILFQHKVILLLNTKEEAEQYYAHQYDAFFNFRPVVTSPYAAWELEKRGIPAESIDIYFDPHEIYALGIENFQNLETICSHFDRALSEFNHLIKKFNLTLTHYNLYILKFQFDNLTTKIRLLSRLIDAEKPELVVSFSRSEYDESEIINYPGEIPADFNYYSIALKCKGWGIKTAVIRITPGKPEVKQESNSCNRTNVNFFSGPVFFGLRDRLKLSKSLGIKTRAAQVFSILGISIRRKKCIFDFHSSYDWSGIVYDLWKKGYYFYHIRHEFDTHQKMPKKLDAIFQIAKKELRGYCILDSIDFSDLLLSTILSLLEKQISRISDMVTSTEYEIITKKPCIFVSLPKTRADEYIITRIIQYHDIPVISWQHGAYGYHTAPIALYVEYQNSDFHLNWGEGVLTAMQHDPLNRFPCQDVPVGSLQIQQIFKKPLKKTGKVSVLYVTTNYLHNYFYVSYAYPFHDNRLWQVQKEILASLGKCQHKVTYKLHPGRHPGEDAKEIFTEYIVSRKIENIQIIINEYKYIDLLEQSEIVIIDFPSTVLLQAIAAHKIIFVYLGFLRINEDALNLLKKRVYCAYTSEELEKLLYDYLKNEPLDQYPDVNNTEFLEQYGLCSLDDSVEERAIDLIEKQAVHHK